MTYRKPDLSLAAATMKGMHASTLARHVVLAACLAGCAFCGDADSGVRDHATEAIEAMKVYQQSLGFKATGNFRRRSAKAVAEYRCYYARTLELPASYDQLRIRASSATGGAIHP
jgi:hypothetical protein